MQPFGHIGWSASLDDKAEPRVHDVVRETRLRHGGDVCNLRQASVVSDRQCAQFSAFHELKGVGRTVEKEVYAPSHDIGKSGR